MLDDLLHLDEGHTLITAATVGIGLADWIYLKAADASAEAAVKLMEEHQLDVIPLLAADGKAYEFYSILEHNRGIPTRQAINYNSTLPSNTHIKDLIKSFVSTRRSFFFLRNRGEIGGIITLTDLNNRQVKTYLYGLLCDLETNMSQFVRKSLTEKFILNYLQEAASERPKSREQEVLNRYQQDVNQNLRRNHITEYLYFSQFFRLIEETRLYREGLQLSSERWHKFSDEIGDIRNIVAHPAQPLLQGTGEIGTLNNQLDFIYDLNFRLRYWSSTQLKA